MMDTKRPKASVNIPDFPGLITNVDPRDTPPGAAEVQVNICCIRQSVLIVRGGLRQVTFES